MSCDRISQLINRLGSALFLATMVVSSVKSDDLLLAMSHEWPGAVHVSQTGGSARSTYRHVEGNPDLAGAIPRIAAVTFGSAEGTFVASGLDGSIFKIEGSRARLIYQHPGQIRDLALENGEGRVYFSVLATPRGGDPLPDGEIWYFDLRTSRPNRFATITQTMVGGDFWGTFAIQGGVLYAGTLTAHGQIYRIFPTGRSELAAETNLGPIHGLAFATTGNLYLATGSQKIYRTRDLRTYDAVLHDPAGQFTDVTPRP